MANIFFSPSKLQMTLCNLQTIVQFNYKQKLILKNKRIWKDITMYKSYAIENDLQNENKWKNEIKLFIVFNT